MSGSKDIRDVESRWVRDTYQVFYTKPMNKWWDGYAGEEVVVLDDFDPRHAEHLSYYLKYGPTIMLLMLRSKVG